MRTAEDDKALIHKLKFLIRIVAAVAVFSGLIAVYDRIDVAGWIPHWGKRNVTFPKHAWEVGEYIRCAAVTLPKTETSLDCADLHETGTIREMDVTLWGQTTENARIFVCQRTAKSISCHLP